MSKDAKPDAWMRAGPNEAPNRLKPRSTLRIELNLTRFAPLEEGLSCTEVGALLEMLMAEAARQPIPVALSPTVQAFFDRRAEFSRIKGSFGRASVSPRRRRAVYERDGGRCAYCCALIEVADYHCDHVVPQARGGSNAMSNLVASCSSCNLSKAAKLQ